MFARTSVNELIRRFLVQYAAVPQRFRDGEPPPWTGARNAAEGFAEVIQPEEAASQAMQRGPRF
ncbi:MAG: hypothetical protein ACRDHD_03045 [Candidatus Limnocylindria bacterium]